MFSLGCCRSLTVRQYVGLCRSTSTPLMFLCLTTSFLLSSNPTIAQEKIAIEVENSGIGFVFLASDPLFPGSAVMNKQINEAQLKKIASLLNGRATVERPVMKEWTETVAILFGLSDGKLSRISVYQRLDGGTMDVYVENKSQFARVPSSDRLIESILKISEVERTITIDRSIKK